MKSYQVNSLRCGYCLQNGSPFEHSKSECPVLAGLAPCRHCGASGYNNHTETYCSKRPHVSLEHNQVMGAISKMHNPPIIVGSPPSINEPLLLWRYSEIQKTPTKRNSLQLEWTSSSTLLTSSSNSLTPHRMSETSDDAFMAFSNEQILKTSPTAWVALCREGQGRRIASTPSAMSSASGAASTSAKRRLSFETWRGK